MKPSPLSVLSVVTYFSIEKHKTQTTMDLKISRNSIKQKFLFIFLLNNIVQTEAIDNSNSPRDYFIGMT